MAEIKTKATAASVAKFIAAVKPESRREECAVVSKLMQKVTKAGPVMWGTSIVGFGTYTYTYANGKTGDWPVVGFSPRKQALTLYIMPGADNYPALLAKLGKFKMGKSCLYLNRLEDIDLKVLEKLVATAVADMKKKFPKAR